jgi:hypothetical protein
MWLAAMRVPRRGAGCRWQRSCCLPLHVNQQRNIGFITDGGGRTAEVAAIARMLNLESSSYLLFASPHRDYLSEAKLKAEVPGEKQFFFLRNPMLLNVGVWRRWCLFFGGIADSFRVVSRHSFSGFIGLGTYLCIPVFLFARIRRIRCVFIESYTRVDDLSITGRLVYHLRLAHRMYVGHRQLRDKYPRVALVE